MKNKSVKGSVIRKPIIKMTLPLIILILCGWFVSTCKHPPHKKEGKATERIVVEADINKHFYKRLKQLFSLKDSVSIQYSNFHYNLTDVTMKSKQAVVNGKVKWNLYSDKPITIVPPFGTSIIMNPGDSVHISYHNDMPVYYGGNMQSLALLDTLMLIDEQLVKPHIKSGSSVSTIEDYLEFNLYLDHQLGMKIPVIESYKEKIPADQFEYYKSNTIGRIEQDRVEAFIALYDSVKRGYPNLAYSNLSQIWDSTQHKPARIWLQSLPIYNGSVYDYYSFAQMEVYRKFGFDFRNDSISAEDKFTYMLYSRIKQTYKGLVREKLLTHILSQIIFTDMRSNPITQIILKDYYSLPGFPEYKQWVQILETKANKQHRNRING